MCSGMADVYCEEWALRGQATFLVSALKRRAKFWEEEVRSLLANGATKT